MNRNRTFLTTVFCTALLAGCASAPPADTTGQSISGAQSLLGMSAPGGARSGGGTPDIPWAEMIEHAAVTPVAVDLASIPAGVYDPNNQFDNRRERGRIESPISEEQAALLRAQALNLPEQAGILAPGEATPEIQAPIPGASWDSMDYTECCGGGGNVPPDPEMTAGLNHVIAVVNVAFEVYDKTGTSIVGPITFSSFMAGAGCAAPFDPNAIYDEENDRYILGVDNGGEDYCVAVSDDGNPLGNWWVYRFPTDVGGAFFDYPHAGVGRDAIYMGANMFNPGFVEARVWAFDKFAMYAGAPASSVTWSTGNSSTPQPMNLHGFAQGTWPVAGPHYILTDNNFDGNVYGVFSWTDPFGANVLAPVGTVDLAAFTGIAAGFPIDVPQAGSAALLQANDWRVQDAEYRNGNIWMTSTIACNPGGGTVDCARWAQIDPTGPTVLNSGVIASPGEFRIFADLAVNDCDDMAVGYTKSSTAMFPSVFVTGRLSTDPVGTVQPEVALKAGEISYTAFDGSPHRWGDYTGMTIDPDGETFWYLGEYSKDTGTTNGRWGNYIGSFSFATCGGPPLSKRIDWGNDLDNDTIPDKVVEVGNSFPSIYQFTIEYFDPTGPLVQLKDVVPGYWNPVFQVAGPPCNVTRADERRNLFSDVFISCTPPGGEGSYSFVAGSRGTLDPGGAVEFEPSECGAFILNEGAAAFTGRSIHLGPTDPICLAAVRDINGGGLDYTGNGDEDGDGVSDYEEACVFDTDPCVP